MANRQITRRILISAAILIFFIFVLFIQPHGPPSPAVRAPGHLGKTAPVKDDLIKGEIVMPRLGNETAKAELGRATWKYLHTMLARYPEDPSEEQQDTLRSFIYLFARLYPCGECASHFQGHLKKYPPQVSSRNAAAGWGCFIHNEVNTMLNKPLFDCNKLGDFYDCGCADDDAEESSDRGNDGPNAKSKATAHESTAEDEVKILPIEISREPSSHSRWIKNIWVMQIESVQSSLKLLESLLYPISAGSLNSCGDVLTKKKLDPHRNQCRGANFTCLDCMVNFQGTQYRSHTSCISEDQKYQGALYREKPGKNQRKGNNNNNNSKQPARANNGGHRAPYVEDAPDSQVNLPPVAPTPPLPTTETKSKPTKEDTNPVNVFDFLVAENTPNASKVSLERPKEQMRMVDHAPSVFEPSQMLSRVDTDGDEENKEYDVAYEENGFSYGAGPIHHPYPNKTAAVSTEFMTPAPKKKKDRTRRQSPSNDRSATTTSDKKRKRHTEDHDMEDVDTPMLEAPSSVVNHPGTPMLTHSGLTGGLNRMLRSPSLDDDDNGGDEGSDSRRRRYQDPSSPLKRTRRDEKDGHGDSGLGISIKNRAERLVSSMFGGSSVSGSSAAGNEASAKNLARTRRHSSSDDEHAPPQIEVRKSKKTHRVRNASNGHAVPEDPRKTKRKSSAQTDGDRPSRRLKQLEYPDRPFSPRDEDGQMVVYRQENIPDELQRQMATHFLSLVTKGPESARGFSINKVLKRFHRDFTDEFDGDRGRGQGRSRADRERRVDDEKDLFRTLRLKQNDRGEIVVFF
ncbi:hypothetical protein ARAM_006315 [Aspergillus rambellii]|uniref:Sulfhydryl oxidase n=2 Tax=Aspergillus subgen. Nidulantes TaxID=2720870 RepID=A0A0F8U494_9EURO|nr:hypothetical protein ARAM_006315 [Aspergillus rambellii]